MNCRGTLSFGTGSNRQVCIAPYVFLLTLGGWPGFSRSGSPLLRSAPSLSSRRWRRRAAGCSFPIGGLRLVRPAECRYDPLAHAALPLLHLARFIQKNRRTDECLGYRKYRNLSAIYNASL
jgi:hypothetical protein